MNQEEIEMQLWEFIDGNCNETDKQRIALLIADDDMWKRKYKELKELHISIAGNMDPEMPSLRFAKNVMDMVAKEHIARPIKVYINKSIIRGIAAFFILTIASVFIYAFATANLSTQPSEQLSKLNFGEFNFHEILNSPFLNLVIGVNIMLGLVFVDAIIRKKQHRPNT